MKSDLIPKRITWLLLCFAITALAACEQPKCQGSAPRTIETFVPAGVPVTCEDSKSFELDGGIVNFTRVRYGKLMNCAEGDCLSSRLCAIENDEDVFLYKARWFNNPDERPVGLLDACPGYQEPANELDTTECSELANGRTHPLTESSKFKDFMKSQISAAGPFNLCF